MKPFSILIFVLLYALCGLGQTSIPDSLQAALQKEKTDTGRAGLLCQLSYYYLKYQPATALIIAQDAYKISVEKKYLKGQGRSLGQIAGAFNKLGNHPKALQYYVEQLKIKEKEMDPKGMSEVNQNIALVYNSENDTGKALYYAYKADSIVVANNLSSLYPYTLLNLGDIYANANQLDSALLYTVRAYYNAEIQKNDLVKGTALNNLGNIYLKSGNLEKAMTSYKSSMPLFEASLDYNTLSECKLGLAKTFNKAGNNDSAMYYARQAFTLASTNEFVKHAMDASAFLAQLFKQLNVIDSAYSYQETMVMLKDSLGNRERVRALQNITVSEQMRQKEIEDNKVEQSQQRLQQLQLLGIGIFIPFTFLISALISRRRVHSKFVKFSGVFSLLLLFEYITLLIHPFVSEHTGHSPVVEIMVLVTIALIITPIHHRIEQWLTSKLAKIHETHLQSHPKKSVKKNVAEEK